MIPTQNKIPVLPMLLLLLVGCGTTQKQLKPTVEGSPTNQKLQVKRTETPAPTTRRVALKQGLIELLQSWERKHLDAQLNVESVKSWLSVHPDALVDQPLISVYQKRMMRPALVRAGRMTGPVTMLRRVLSTVAEHGLNPAKYEPALIENNARLLEGYAKRRAALLSNLPAGTLIRTSETGQLEQLRKKDPVLHSKLLKLRVELPQIATAAYRLDVALVRATIRLGITFWYNGGAASGTQQLINLLVHNRRHKQLKKRIESWIPKNQVYLAFKQKLALFRGQLKSEPTFPPVGLVTRHRGRKLRHRRIQLRRGKKYSVLKAIHPRFVAWGYLPKDAPLTIRYDDQWREALWKFQAEHGLARYSAIDGPTVALLRMSARTRVRTLLAVMKKWRESTARRYKYFLRVNIPAFLLEIHFNDRVVGRHRVVVGNNKFDTDPTTKKKGRLNQTSELSSFISQVIINPIWRVPPRIKQNEIDKEVEKDPEYLEKHRYKVITLSNGRELVQQMPGKGNALGRVKFMFPNRHGIYLHDTPAKKLFRLPKRAFSHGCIRLHRPLDLVKRVMENDSNISIDAVRSIIRTQRETVVRLNSRVPIIIEYQTAGLSEKGQFQFYRDIYRRMRGKLEGVPLEGY